MKLAVTAKENSLDSEIDPRFGRAAYIIVIDSDSMDYEIINNSENLNALKGAGIQTAASISEKKAEVLFTGFCGPNAFKTLNAAGIKVVNEVTGTVRDAVKVFKEGKFSFSDNANVEGHW